MVKLTDLIANLHAKEEAAKRKIVPFRPSRRKSPLQQKPTGADAAEVESLHAARTARAQAQRSLGKGTLPQHGYGGTTLAPGTWLYAQFPGAGSSDALVLVRYEKGTRFGGWWVARTDGGAGEERRLDHGMDDADLRSLRRGNYTRHLGYLELVIPDAEARARFVESRREEPARRAAAKAQAQRLSAEQQRTIGRWYVDVEREASRTVGGPDSVPDTTTARILRRFLKTHGIDARITVRRYSMASGMEFGAPENAPWTAADKARIGRLLPWISVNGGGIHPSRREDRSDTQADYHSPGGFRVAPDQVEALQAIVRDEVQKDLQKAAPQKKAEPVQVWAPEWRPGDILLQAEGGYGGSQVVRVKRILSMETKGGRVKPTTEDLGMSTTFDRKRALLLEGRDAILTPDFTNAKLKERGGEILRTYAPDLVRPRTRVLFRGGDWWATPPGEKAATYTLYAYDVTPS